VRREEGSPTQVDVAQPGRAPDGPEPVRTFLIADIRGYTRYTQERGDEEGGRLAAAFADIAREVVTANGGELLELRGDEALSIFVSARQAVRTAVELQRRFRAQDADGRTAFPLAIGVGLDSGEAVPIQGGYRGRALNVASRLCSLAAPGQILASDTVASLAGRIQGVRFIPRRPVRLKGIEKPVRAVEVLAEPALPPLPKTPMSKRPRITRGGAAAVALVGLGLLVAMLVLVVVRSRGPDFRDHLDANALGVIDAEAAAIEAQVSLLTRPSAVAVGGGFIWVASEEDGAVSRIDPETFDVQTRVVGRSAAGVAYGAGSVWVTNSDEQSVVQINPDTLTDVQTITVGNGPSAIAASSQAVWVANTLDATVSRIDLDRGRAARPIPLGTAPTGITVGAGGVWILSEAGGTLFRLDPRSQAIVESIPVGNGPSAVAVSEDGVWVANRQDGTLFRVDPQTNRVVDTIDVGPTPVSLAAGNGAVWVAIEGDGTVVRVDAEDGQVKKTVSLTSRPNSLALFGDTVWASTLASLSSHRGGVLRVEAELSACQCIDPAGLGDIANFTDGAVTTLAYDGLVAYRRVGGVGGSSLVGNLALRVPTPNDQGRTYTFQLRPGIHYSNGAPVRASDFRYSLERLFTINRDFASRFYSGIVGATDCTARPPARCDLSRGIDVDDAAGRITIHLRKADPDFLHKLAIPLASVIPAGTLLRIARDDAIPGTGSYQVTESGPRHSLRLVRNSHFRMWSHDARPDGYPDEIRLHESDLNDSEQLETSLAAVRAGDADMIDVSAAGGSLKSLLTRPGGTVHLDPAPVTFWFFLNTRVPPFDDVRVRRALNFAVDRQPLLAAGGGPPFVAPSCQILPPGFPGYRPYCPYTLRPNAAGTWTAPDVARAKEILAASGTRGMHVEVVVHAFPPVVKAGRYFTRLLRDLGYRSSLRVIPDFAQYNAYVSDSRKRVQIGFDGWLADWLTPSFLRTLFSCASFQPQPPANLNRAEFCDPEIDLQMARAAAAQSSDAARANELWAAVDHAIVDRAVVVPTVTIPSGTYLSDRVGNYQNHPLWGPLLDQLWVE
jgi:ABC-type transport system substrate-binding protein/class 3 adenylate cyclase/streptogramin lyase